MNTSAKKIQNIYLTLVATNTLAASLIWGINTLFLLDAGLNNAEAFLVNAFFTIGMVLFEVPTGVVADTWGRRFSYVLGTITLAISTGFYLYAWQIQAPIILWIISSILLGLGFTFFSGATEAWLVDCLKHAKYKGNLESIFAKGQVVNGTAMLSGAITGGLVAQFTNLGVPYILRIIVLGLNFFIAVFFMKDLGFVPEKGETVMGDMKKIMKSSVDHGFRKPPVRWLILAGPFGAGAGIYAFYAMQPYLLELYGNQEAYWVAGSAAAIIAGSQIMGGLIATRVRAVFKKRTSLLAAMVLVSTASLVLIGMTNSLFVAIGFMVLWALAFAASMPIRQALMNELIPSKQRATVLSFDSLVSSTGGAVSQPLMGRVADLYSYSISFIGIAIFRIISFPFILLCKGTNTEADKIKD